MADWLDRFARLAMLGERITVLADGLKTMLGKVDDHEKRLVRLETIIEIVRADTGAVLRLATEDAARDRTDKD